jgi:predicted DsbA family dithiol-disulfide isomerase
MSQVELTVGGKERVAVEIIHYADPWCWWSWGLEPVLQRLKEVYGNQVRVTYKMAGVFDDVKQWMNEYGVENDQALVNWVKDSSSITRMPTDPSYLVKAGVKSSWPACIAVKAAQLQGEHLAELFYRRLMEEIQVEAKNGSEETIYLQIAKEAGLDPSQLQKDAKSQKLLEEFHKDMETMKKHDINYLTLVLKTGDGREEAISEVFTAAKYEEVLEKLSAGSLTKKTPIDIIEYLERYRQFLVPSREIAEVFATSDEDAENRLAILERGGLLKKREFDFDGGAFWMFNKDSSQRRKLTMEEVEAAHVTASARVESETDLSEIVTKAVQNLYSEVALNPTKEYHFPVGRAATLFVGYPEEEINNIPPTAVESFAGVV